MNILFTGHRGFLGREVIPHLLKTHDVFYADIDYTNKDFGYGHCVDEELKLLMKSTFGCVPVWLHPYDGCEQEIPNNNNDTTDMKKKADDEGWRLVTNHRLQVMEQCQESCTLTTTTIEIISIRDNFPGMARLNLR